MATLQQRRDHTGEPKWWILQWSDAQGPHRVTLGEIAIISERRARDILRAKQLELSTGARLLNLTTSIAPTFANYAREYQLWHQSEYPASTARVQQIIAQHLMPVFEHVALDRIEPATVEQFKHDRRRDHAKAHTITKELRTLMAIINHAVRNKVIRDNPIAMVSAPRILDSKPHLFYEVDDLARLYAACTAKVNNGQGPQPVPLHAAIWKLYANTGMRRGEGLHLRKKWIGREGIKLVSTEEARTKSAKWREVPKTEGAAEAIDRLKHAVDGDYILPRIDQSMLSRAFLRDAARAKIEGSMHTLRHTYISHLVRDTQIPMRTVQLFAGHSTIAVTEQYAYLRDNTNSAHARGLNL
jgi:integrase